MVVWVMVIAAFQSPVAVLLLNSIVCSLLPIDDAGCSHYFAVLTAVEALTALLAACDGSTRPVRL